MDELIAAEPELGQAFMRSTLEALRSAHAHMILLGHHHVAERMARFLLLLHRHASADNPFSARTFVTVPLSRNDLSALLGTTAETISRLVHRLADDGVIRIETTSRFEILDMAQLLSMAGPEDD